MRLSLFIILFSAFNAPLFSQTIKGKVVDEFNHSLQQVNILNITADEHTHTNEYGKFTFENISIGDTLIFSHVGFQEEQLIIEDLDKSLELVLYNTFMNLDEIVISPQVNPLQIIAEADIQVNPVNSAQEVLRKVPGLFIGQHAGGGKAEQIFLRGFDIDHGTDITLSVDGLPVNMVSHAHGQGYADMHFVIPETIGKIDFGLGPYYANKGNFNTAGYVDFNTKQKLDDSSIKLESGQFDTHRLLGMFNLINSNDRNAYVATEFLSTNGPFDSPQNFSRINVFGKYNFLVSETNKVDISLSHFTSEWDASGQIPQRAVDSGLITRFGAIDDTEGGLTSRSNLRVSYDKFIDENSSIKSMVYLSQYNFELFSNFTFFLEDSINGDQIRQNEERVIYGMSSEYKKSFTKDEDLSGDFTLGVSLRNDRTDNTELSSTLNRKETLNQIALGDINETNFGAYAGTSLNYKKLTFSPSLRLDYFNFQYNDALLTLYQTQAESKVMINPKLSLLYNQSPKLQLYFKSGRGFHSNDSRVVVAQSGEKILPAAYSFDVGYIWKPASNMLVSMAYWRLYLEQEFVYVGDAGIVEPSGISDRQGFDLNYRYQPLSWLFWDLNVNYTHVRFTEEEENMAFVPLAPDFTLVSGINIILKKGFYGSINLRHLDDRPANEDNSIVAKGYTITDLNLGYKWRNLSFGIQIQNLFNNEWNETQFATESQLRNETEPVEEINFTPGTPFFVKSLIKYNF